MKIFIFIDVVPSLIIICGEILSIKIEMIHVHMNDYDINE